MAADSRPEHGGLPDVGDTVWVFAVPGQDTPAGTRFSPPAISFSRHFRGGTIRMAVRSGVAENRIHLRVQTGQVEDPSRHRYPGAQRHTRNGHSRW